MSSSSSFDSLNTAGTSFACAITAEPSDNPTLAQQAQVLAQTLNLPLIDSVDHSQQPELLLVVTHKRYEFRWAEPAEQAKAVSRKKSRKPVKAVTGSAIFADWSSLNIASAAGTSIKQPIAKALGLKVINQTHAVRVIDTTAGWGEDAWVMASLGCHVLMIERNPIIVVMLQDAIDRERARSPQTTSRLHVINDDATQLLQKLVNGQSLQSQHPQALKDSVWDKNKQSPADVIHLDPMFPGEKTSAEKKPMRLLRKLVGDDTDAQSLFDVALKCNVKRVIIKRPPHGPSLGNKPQVVIAGKASRYDVHVSHIL